MHIGWKLPNSHGCGGSITFTIPKNSNIGVFIFFLVKKKIEQHRFQIYASFRILCQKFENLLLKECEMKLKLDWKLSLWIIEN